MGQAPPGISVWAQLLGIGPFTFLLAFLIALVTGLNQACARASRELGAPSATRAINTKTRARAQVLGLGWAGRLVSSAVVPVTPSQPMPEAGAVQADPQPGTIAMYPVSELPRVFNKEGYQPRGDLLRDLCSQGYPSDDCRGLDARSAARQAPTSASPDK